MNYKKKKKPPYKESWVKKVDENGAVYLQAGGIETIRMHMARMKRFIETIEPKLSNILNGI